jgi:anti-anti-sigma factor
MGILVEIRDGSAHVAIEGDLTVSSVQDIRAALAAVVVEHDETEIDLGSIEEIDSAGLQLMLIAKRSEGRTVRFVNHSDAVLRLLDLANLGAALGDPVLIACKAVR